MFLHFWLGNVLRATTAKNVKQWSKTISFLDFWLENVLRATTVCTFSTSELPKVVFYTFWTWKRASRHNSVHFMDISTCKSGPSPAVFYTLDLKMCFVPQRRALFRHLNFQKWFEGKVLLAFLLTNVLRTTTACTFSTSQLPKVVRTWGAFSFLKWKCASRDNGVQFFISLLASWLRTRRFSEVTFSTLRSPKSSVNRDFPTFSRTCLFLLLTLSLLWSSHFLTSPPWLFPPLLFHLSILSEVWLLNFLRLSIHHWCWIYSHPLMLLKISSNSLPQKITSFHPSTVIVPDVSSTCSSEPCWTTTTSTYQSATTDIHIVLVVADLLVFHVRFWDRQVLPAAQVS